MVYNGWILGTKRSQTYYSSFNHSCIPSFLHSFIYSFRLLSSFSSSFSPSPFLGEFTPHQGIRISYRLTPQYPILISTYYNYILLKLISTYISYTISVASIYPYTHSSRFLPTCRRSRTHRWRCWGCRRSCRQYFHSLWQNITQG